MEFRQTPLGGIPLEGLGPEADVPYGLLLQLQEEYRTDEEENEVSTVGEPPKKGLKKNPKKRKDPNAPKKAKSAYSFFMQEKRSEISEGHPDKSFGEISRLVSERWKTLSPEQRAEYEAKAKQDKERYQKQMAEYIPPEDDNGHPKKRKRRKKDPSAPKKNSSAFLFFSQEARPRIKALQPELSTTDISKVLGEQWKALSKNPQDRARYDLSAREDKLRYERQMEEWHSKKHGRISTMTPQAPQPTHHSVMHQPPPHYSPMQLHPQDSPLHLHPTLDDQL